MYLMAPPHTVFFVDGDYRGLLPIVLRLCCNDEWRTKTVKREPSLGLRDVQTICAGLGRTVLRRCFVSWWWPPRCKRILRNTVRACTLEA